jgi:hypothetical protein
MMLVLIISLYQSYVPYINKYRIVHDHQGVRWSTPSEKIPGGTAMISHQVTIDNMYIFIIYNSKKELQDHPLLSSKKIEG